MLTITLNLNSYGGQTYSIFEPIYTKTKPLQSAKKLKPTIIIFIVENFDGAKGFVNCGWQE